MLRSVPKLKSFDILY